MGSYSSAGTRGLQKGKTTAPEESECPGGLEEVPADVRDALCILDSHSGEGSRSWYQGGSDQQNPLDEERLLPLGRADGGRGSQKRLGEKKGREEEE